MDIDVALATRMAMLARQDDARDKLGSSGEFDRHGAAAYWKYGAEYYKWTRAEGTAEGVRTTTGLLWEKLVYGFVGSVLWWSALFS